MYCIPAVRHLYLNQYTQSGQAWKKSQKKPN